MGTVWAATHAVTKKRVAIKFLKPALALNPQTHKRFLREARAASAVRHPNVVQIHDVIEEGGAPVMVMDLLEGESLADRLERLGALRVDEACVILEQVVSAMEAAHALGIVHRDLKPDNIFLVRQSDGSESVRVLDFGIAKLTATEGDAAQTAGLTSTGSMLGTPYYMSPEQATGEKSIDGRSDVWSLGIILYECLTGRRPTEADTLGQVLKIIMTGAIRPIQTLAPHLPPDLAEMVMSMLAHERDARRVGLPEIRATLRAHSHRGTSASDAPRPIGAPGRAVVALTPQADPLAGTEVLPDARATTRTSRRRRVLVFAATAASTIGLGLAAMPGLERIFWTRAPTAEDGASATASAERVSVAASLSSEPAAASIPSTPATASASSSVADAAASLPARPPARASSGDARSSARSVGTGAPAVPDASSASATDRPIRSGLFIDAPY